MFPFCNSFNTINGKTNGVVTATVKDNINNLISATFGNSNSVTAIPFGGTHTAENIFAVAGNQSIDFVKLITNVSLRPVVVFTGDTSTTFTDGIEAKLEKFQSSVFTKGTLTDEQALKITDTYSQITITG